MSAAATDVYICAFLLLLREINKIIQIQFQQHVKIMFPNESHANEEM